MGRPRKLSGVLLNEQVPLWAEAGTDPQPYPLHMLARLSVLMDNAFDLADAVGIKRLSDACRDWYALCLPAAGAAPKAADEWEKLAEAFQHADAAQAARAADQ